MKKIMFIILAVVAMVGCEKEELSFEGTKWSKSSGEYKTTLDFYSSSKFKSVGTKVSNSEILTTDYGTYSVESGVAYMKFDASFLSDHEAVISGNSLKSILKIK